MDIENFNFNVKMKKLEEISKDLEKNDLDLEESIRLYKEGIDLYKKCQLYLENTKGKIIEIRDEQEIELE